MRPALDWSRPWLAPLRPWGERLPLGVDTAAALDAVGSGAARFVAASEMPTGEAYEAFIARTGQVPTRDNLHDLFNGLVWQRHPALKQRLNRLQAAEIETRGLGGTRGPVRDALTLFDEFGALWPDPPVELLDALRRRDWAGLFVTHRARWAGTGFEVFGHALLEQLARAPRKALTAHVLVGDPLQWPSETWASKPFLPLPVLGVPGWWPANEDPKFYEDSRVFRPARP